MKPQFIENQGMLIEGNFWQVHPQTCLPWNEQSAADFIADYQAPSHQPDTIEAQKAEAIDTIKKQAAARIVALDWKLQRAEERLAKVEFSGVTGDALEQAEDDVVAVLDERDAIRQQSNLAEERLMSLTDIEQISHFSW